MIERLAKRAVALLKGHSAIDASKEEVYVYGADLVIYTLLSTAGLLLAGALCHLFWQSAVIIALYYTNQPLGGGYHASTHGRCFLMMLAGLMAALLSYALPIALWAQYALMLLCAGILLLHPLVLHANKQYLKAQSSRLIKRSRWVTLLLGYAGLAALLLGWRAFAQAWMLGLMVSAISRLGGFKAR